MAKKFKGVVNLDVRDSVRRLDPVPRGTGPRGCSERAAGAVRRHRPGRLVAVRRADQHADDAAARRQRADLHPVAHHSAVLADPVLPADRPQPPPERLRADRRGRPGLPRPHRAHPDGERHHRRGPARERLQHVLGRQEPQRARWTSGRWAPPSATGRSRAGFDRFYGFIGGETNNWYPTLAEDNHYVDQPYLPEDGYHLSKDLADKAITLHRRQQDLGARRSPGTCGSAPAPTTLRTTRRRSTSPSTPASSTTATRPTASGCCRGWSSAASSPRGPRSPTSTRCPGEAAQPLDHVRPWDELNDDEKRLFARMAEVYAGFSEYTDAQVGRIIDYLEETGQLENTIVMYCADNGASGEGSPDGTVNENKFFNAYPDDLEREPVACSTTSARPDTYNHYPTGWATAFSTPFKMFKRYTYQGRRRRPAGDLLAERHRGPRRGAQPVPPRGRHRADDPGVRRAGDARPGAGLRAVARCPASR